MRRLAGRLATIITTARAARTEYFFRSLDAEGWICSDDVVELTKQHKVLLGIVALGAGAVVVDRFVLDSGVSGPSPVNAAVPSASEQTAPEKQVYASMESLAARVEKVEVVTYDESDVARAFEPSSSWFPGDNVSTPISQSDETIGEGQFKLSSVMTKPIAAAVINGHMVRAGQNYAFGVGADGQYGLLRQAELKDYQKRGFGNVNSVQLVSVLPRSEDNLGSAVIEVDGRRVELVIDQSEKH